jgi:tetratricopeptide (TPR) repeat protein
MTSISSRVARFGTAFFFASLIFLGGCSGVIRMYQNWNVSRYDAAIRRAGQSLAAASNDKQRAAGYADRADAYAEKARYSRIMKLIAIEEYTKIFDLALHDFSQALALDPGNTQIYFRRGNAYYFRAGLDMIYAPYESDFLAPAKADFSRALESDPKNMVYLDMLGLTDASMRDWTSAIADFERESALDPKQGYRVSDAYCNRGASYPKEKFDLAIADLKQSIQSRNASDPCECEPYNPLLWIYIHRTHEYDKAREVVALARRSGKWIDPENLKQLDAASSNR